MHIHYRFNADIKNFFLLQLNKIEKIPDIQLWLGFEAEQVTWFQRLMIYQAKRSTHTNKTANILLHLTSDALILVTISVVMLCAIWYYILFNILLGIEMKDFLPQTKMK